jgi:hypothetical protein
MQAANSCRLNISGEAMMNIKAILITAVAVGAALGMGRSAQAVTITKTVFVDPSAACQLSIPTTDTGVRPRATGYRNEGVNAFVICGATYLYSSLTVSSLQINLRAFDGATHDMTCTAVDRSSSGGNEVYSSKSVSVGSGANFISWMPADLNNFSNFAVSVTCSLPSGVAIAGIRLSVPDDVGA